MAYDAELLQQLIDGTDAMIYLKDEDGRFLLVNRKAAEAMNASPEQIVGKMDSDFLPATQVEKFREQDRKVAESGKPLNYRTTIDMPRGRVAILDHKFPVAVKGHEHAVGGIAVEVPEK